MGYLCTRQLTAGGVTYHPGEAVPDGVILPERCGKLIGGRYISELDGGVGHGGAGGPGEYYTHEQLERLIAEAIDDAVDNTVAEMEKEQGRLRECGAELQDAAPGACGGTVLIPIRGTADGGNEQVTAIPARPEEIQQVFSILQMNAEEGSKAIADVTSENVLILLHAADSRKTIKNAARERASRLMYMAESQAPEGQQDRDTDSGAGEAYDGKAFLHI